MVSLDWRVDFRDGVTLVELTVTNPTDAARRVRIANRLDGTVWPPRRQGVPEAGWDDGGFEGVVAPGGRRALGYATPAPAADSPAADSDTDVSTDDASTADPPVEIVWTERAGAFESISDSERTPESNPTIDSTPEGVVRALGDARPPADAVPRPDVGGDPNFDSNAPGGPSSRRSP